MLVADTSYRSTLIQAQRMIEDSRRWLHKFYRDYPKMTCLLCDRESITVHRVQFEVRDDEHSLKRLSANVMMKLQTFGVCPQCAGPFRERRMRLIEALNRVVQRQIRTSR
jgi:hypothetical protein